MSLAGLLTILDDDPQLHDVVSRAESDTASGAEPGAAALAGEDLVAPPTLRPVLTAALGGRLAPVAERWLGIDPDQVEVSLHTGPGWGSAGLTGSGAQRRLRVSRDSPYLFRATGTLAPGAWTVTVRYRTSHRPGYEPASVIRLTVPNPA